MRYAAAMDIDLQRLSARESEQVEWEGGVGDPEDVVRTLSAFANDLANLDLAQAEGQGLATIRRSLAANGNPSPEYEHVVCTLRAHPRAVDAGERGP